AVMQRWNMHHVPSPEMEELDLDAFFVARINGRIIGAAGYKVLSQTRAKTTLLAVLPEYSSLGIGAALQRKRLEAMHRIGVKKVVTNADRPATIRWYQEHFGYEAVGTLKKVSEFGDPQVDHWTTLELDLEGYIRRTERDAFGQRYLE